MRVARPGLVFLLTLSLLTGCSRLPLPHTRLNTATSIDTARRGPYGVGLAYRKLTRVLPDGQTQPIQTWIWSPSADQGEQTTATVSAKPGLIRPVAAGRPFPLIVFSAGYQSSPTLYSRLISQLVSHGFVVAGPEHQDCQPPCSAQGLARQDENRPLDVSAVLDALVGLSDGGDPLLQHLIDPTRVGVAGHSLGGWTTLTVLQRDPRFKAGLAMAPAIASVPPPEATRVSRPVMLVAGVLDT